MPPLILHETKDLIVVDKACGVLSVPSRIGSQETRPVLGIQLQEQLQKQVYPVHRLDFEVSGVMIFALNANTHKILNTAFEAGRVRKTYQALSSKTENSEEFSLLQIQEWHSKILRGKKRSFFADYGKEALTHAKLLGKSENNIYEWELHPITGRSHQLRLELSSRGYPILGDSLYGSPLSFKPNSIALRCIEIDLTEVPHFHGVVFKTSPLELIKVL